MMYYVCKFQKLIFMKKLFTMRPLALKTLLICLAFASTNLYGQREFIFTVNSPAGVAGDYDVLHASFGALCAPDAITGDWVIADDGTANPTEACSPVTNDLTGNVALIDRGSCNFSIKCYNAQQAGATAVIVCNNISDPIFVMGAGMFAEDVTIPCLMLSQNDCNIIRSSIPTVNVTIDPNIQPTPPETDIVYYEEDFNAGANGWTSVSTNEPDEIFFWNENGLFPTFTGGSAGSSLAGASCSGAMGFPGGWYQTNMTGIADSAPAQPANYIDFNAELISPLLDLSAIPDPLALKFNQHFRRLNGNTGAGYSFVSYSIDGGDTWAPNIPLNEDVEVNNDPLSSTIRVSIPEIQGQANVRIKFIYQMDFYYWVVDDVKLIKRPNNDLVVMENFYAIAPNAVTPASQVDCFGFLADVNNAGALPQDNVNLNIKIVDDATSTTVYEDDLGYGTVPADQLAENGLIGGVACYTPTAAVADYTGTYTVTSDSSEFDFTPDNNTVSFAFSVSDTVFAKETGVTGQVQPVQTVWDEDENHHWAIGNHFYVVNGTTPDGANRANSATFAMANAATLGGRSVFVYLYKWTDNNNDEMMQGDERTRVAFAVYGIQGTEANDELVTVPLLTFPLNGQMGADLEANTDYVLMVEYEPNDQVDFIISSSGAYDYSAMAFRADSVMVPRYANFVGFGVPLTSEAYSSTSFGRDLVPVIRLNISKATTISTEELSANNKLLLSPNPANKQLMLDIDLVNAQDRAQIQIMDVNGRMIISQEYQNIQKEVVSYDLTNFASGTYFLQFVTEEGVRTERFVVQH